MKLIEIQKTTWSTRDYYSDLTLVGCGSFGQVCSAHDSKFDRNVAIKKLSRPFINNYHAKRAYCEIWLLKNMNHENLINLLDLYTPDETPEVFNDVYLVTPYMGSDLCNLMKMQSLSAEHVQFLTYQILRGLKYVHSAGILHRDLKPSNIVVNESCELKILDFGLARSYDEAEMTGYVATRWYRAPELLLNFTKYTTSVDIWSVGCIMAEMITRKVLCPGNGPLDQLMKIIEVCGPPSQAFVDKVESSEAKKYLASLPHINQKGDLSTIFLQPFNPNALDLLKKMLVWDPDYRINAVEALAHPYFDYLADPEDEPSCDKDLGGIINEVINDPKILLDEWKAKIFEMIVNFSEPCPT